MTKKSLRSFLLFMFLFIAGNVDEKCLAKTYRSDMLQEMSVYLDFAIDSIPDGLYFRIINGHEIICRIENDEIAHIGYKIFSDQMREGIGIPLADFVERYWLSLDLPMHRLKSVSEQLREDHVFFLKGGLFSLEQIQADSSLTVRTETNEKNVTITWGDLSDCVCQLTFPVDPELILGRSLKENELRFLADLAKVKIEDICSREYSLEELTPSDKDEMFLLCGDDYYTRELSSTQYFFLDTEDSTVHPVFSRKYPAESIANLFGGANIEVAENFKMTLRHKIYEFKEHQIETNVRQFVSFCLLHGCTPFIGIVSMDSDFADIFVVMRNVGLGYNHVLRLNMNINDLAVGTGIITGRLNTYIRTSNIKNLFKEQYNEIS